MFDIVLFDLDKNIIGRLKCKIKITESNRINGHITSLKRRVTQQQLRHNKYQVTTFQGTTYELPSSIDLVLISYVLINPEGMSFANNFFAGILASAAMYVSCRKESLSSRHYEMKQSSCVVCLPSLVKNAQGQ
ncbi:unnamed protein product [Rotaria socialis]